MTQINLWSFVAALLCQIVGVFWHYQQMKSAKRVSVSFFTYLFYGTKKGQGTKVFAIFATTWFAATSGAADLINPSLLWSMLIETSFIHISSMNAILFAVTAGYTADSVGQSISK